MLRLLRSKPLAVSRRALLRGSPGFKLIEMLVVLVIIGLIMGLGGQRVLSYLTDARVKATKLQIEAFGSALDLYFLDNGRYPSTSDGLDALVRRPGGGGGGGGPGGSPGRRGPAAGRRAGGRRGGGRRRRRGPRARAPQARGR